ncbi:hypothetical protein CCOS865_02359 [Pseudomonas reidholzensis]|uniref:Uncharacterized protein n=1 Tax=Pseudomonas reidholzensis TaxID=1785162 RepID=A0A383RTG5_9PSED|nr:hypothetical protein [Pseudomonas reidholzensis]SYX90093.1 hypothetical protein CCOS865_02359 [Pseudomonas reidholzensis]
MRMKRLVVLLMLAGSAQAELDIQSSSDNPRGAERISKMQAAMRERPTQTSSFPTLDQTNAALNKAKLMVGLSAQSIKFHSPSRAAIETLDCSLANEAPSGVERKDGGLNGVMSVYSCGAAYVVTYEYNYEVALTQRVGVLDDDFARHTDKLNPLIKTTAVSRGGTRLTMLRWLSPENQISYEVYADLATSVDDALEQRLRTALRDTALRLSEAKPSAPEEAR